MINQLAKLVHKEKRLAVGLMSGTSLDGVDAALVEIDSFGTDTKVELIHFETLTYDADVKKQVLRLCSPSTSSVDAICRLNVTLGEIMAQAALKVIESAGKSVEEIDFISSHGQTIYHMPENKATLQIGELAVIAAKTKCITVGDFRPNDMAVGGQGAPLVPYVDYLLFMAKDMGRILINIGGISNLSVLKANALPEDVLAFDTGPGNVLIDAIVRIGTNGKHSYDEGGKIAAQGKVCQEWLDELLSADQFMNLKPPKSTGREYYSMEMAHQLWTEGNSRKLLFEDIVATITQYTVQLIVTNIQRHVEPKVDIHEVLVGGGGVHNKYLMEQLQAQLKQKVSSMEELDFSSDAKEAIAFAILGNEFLHGRTNNLPSATGADRDTIMGKLVLP